jgi:hypothetical protein
MLENVDHDRLIMTGVLIAALILWGGIVGEFTGLYPDGKTTAAAALGVFIPIFAVFMLLRDYLGDTDSSAR